MLLSIVTHLITIFNMQKLIVVCDMNATSLEEKKSFFRGKVMINVVRSLDHIEDGVLSESNVIACADMLGKEGMVGMTKKGNVFAVHHPCVILHNNDQEKFVSATKINQQLYFYNQDTHSLRERYGVNLVTVTRELDMRLPFDNVNVRRADLQGVGINLAVNHFPPLYEVRKKVGTKTLPSGDKVHPLNADDVFGMFEDIIAVMSRELNFSMR